VLLAHQQRVRSAGTGDALRLVTNDRPNPRFEILGRFDWPLHGIMNALRDGAVGFIVWLGHSEDNDACSKEAECRHQKMHRDAGPPRLCSASISQCHEICGAASRDLALAHAHSEKATNANTTFTEFAFHLL